MKKSFKKIVVIGATSLIAQKCLNLWVEDYAVEVILVGRNLAKLKKVASKLRVRSKNILVNTIQIDFLNTLKIQKLANDLNKNSPIDILLIAHGVLPNQILCQSNLTLCKNAIEINAISPALFAEAFVGFMERSGKGCLAILGSVAGDRGRRSNYIYGASKGFIERYIEGLQHRLAHTDINVILVKIAPTDTPMTRNHKNRGLSLASVDKVAEGIVSAISRRRSLIYVPSKWYFIMAIIKHLPKFIFNKMSI
jgi:short-subunit dehydrogenase